jgi:shikimate kinase
VVRRTNRQALWSFGFVVWLGADPSVLLDRLRLDPFATDDRPALTPAGTLEEITEVLATRLPLYREVADAVIETDGRTPEEVAEAILEVFPGSPSRWPTGGDAT